MQLAGNPTSMKEVLLTILDETLRVIDRDKDHYREAGPRLLLALLVLQHYAFSQGMKSEAKADYKSAFRFFQLASELGNTRASARLATYYRTGMGAVQLDFRKAFRLAEAAYEAGWEDEAGWLYGTCLQQGTGCAIDRECALAVLRQAAAVDPLAWWEVSLCVDPPQSAASGRAFEALKACARADNPIAQFRIAHEQAPLEGGRYSDRKEGLEWLRKAAVAGVSAAQHLLGACYSQGMGVERSVPEALRWYERAAAQGEGASSYNLAINLQRLYGRHHNRAFEYLREGAQRGYVPAIFNVGCAFLEGEGCPRDPARAAQHFLMAAERNCIPAMRQLGVQYSLGDGVPMDEGEAFKWFLEGAKREHVASMKDVAICYANGDGVARDDVEAAIWAARASLPDRGVPKSGPNAQVQLVPQLDPCEVHLEANERAHRRAVAYFKAHPEELSRDHAPLGIFLRFKQEEDAVLGPHECNADTQRCVYDLPIPKSYMKTCAGCGKTGAKLLKCCEGNLYCSRDCQKAAWKDHRKVCKRRGD